MIIIVNQIQLDYPLAQIQLKFTKMIINEQTVSKIQRRGANRLSDFMQMYKNLNIFIEKVNEKITNRIQLVSSVYIQDYKLQISMMTEQLKNMRHLLDEELLAQRSNERLFYLEEERDFFRGKTLKMNEELTKLARVNDKLREQLDNSEVETKNYKNLVFSLQSKINRMQSESFQMEKIKLMHTKMPAISVEKQERKGSLQLAATKESLSKFLPMASMSLIPQEKPILRSSSQLKASSQKDVNPQLKKRDEIIDDCIKQIKKKIFYRTMSQSLAQTKHQFNEDIRITFKSFKKTDKEELIRLILSNELLLDEFTGFLTKQGEQGKGKNGMVKMNKSSFNDKLFRIKLNGLENQGVRMSK